jgi:DNA-binding CsgD family transcriptional regulator
MAPVLITAIILIYYNFKYEMDSISLSMLDKTRYYSNYVDRELNDITIFLQVLALSPYIDSLDFKNFHAESRRVLSAYPDAAIILADQTGQQMVNSYLPIGTPLPKRNRSNIDKHFFQADTSSVSDLFRGAVSGRLMLGVDVPVVRNGHAIFDLGMSIPVDNIIETLSLPKLTPDWTATILDSNDVIVARTKDPEKFVGSTGNTPILLKNKLISNEGTFRAIGLSGTPVLAGYSHSVKSGWTMVISVPEAIVMRDLWRWLHWAVAGTVILGGLGILIAVKLGNSIKRSIEKLMVSAKALGRGELVDIGRHEFIETQSVAESLANASTLIMQHEEAHKKFTIELEQQVIKRTLDLKQTNSFLEEEINKREALEEQLILKNKSLIDGNRTAEDNNIALKVLLDQREKDRQIFQDQILTNMRLLVKPYLERIRGEVSNHSVHNCLEIIQRNVDNITSGFASSLTNEYRVLTANEIRVADLIRGGLSSKDIASMLSLSPRTVEAYRESIRKKLGLSQRKINLREYLLKLSQ